MGLNQLFVLTAVKAGHKNVKDIINYINHTANVSLTARRVHESLNSLTQRQLIQSTAPTQGQRAKQHSMTKTGNDVALKHLQSIHAIRQDIKQIDAHKNTVPENLLEQDEINALLEGFNDRDTHFLSHTPVQRLPSYEEIIAAFKNRREDAKHKIYIGLLHKHHIGRLIVRGVAVIKISSFIHIWYDNIGNAFQKDLPSGKTKIYVHTPVGVVRLYENNTYRDLSDCPFAERAFIKAIL